MNIAVVCEQFHFGGLETHIAGLNRIGIRFGHQLYLITGSVKGDYAHQVFGDKIHISGAFHEKTPTVYSLVDFCLINEIELIHVHPFRSVPVAHKLARALNIPFVITLHGELSIEYLSGLKNSIAIVKDAAAIFCVSGELIKPLLKINPSARYHVLLNSIDVEKTKVALKPANGKWAFIGRLDEIKIQSVKLFVETFLSAFPEKEIEIFGDGDRKDELSEWLIRKGFSQVMINGFTHDLFTSLNNRFEGIAGMCRSFLDGAAMGFPAILAGYDGIKGLMTIQDMPQLAFNNFSGRGLPAIIPQILKYQFETYSRNPELFDLTPWIVENANESTTWGKHFEVLKMFL